MCLCVNSITRLRILDWQELYITSHQIIMLEYERLNHKYPFDSFHAGNTGDSIPDIQKYEREYFAKSKLFQWVLYYVRIWTLRYDVTCNTHGHLVTIPELISSLYPHYWHLHDYPCMESLVFPLIMCISGSFLWLRVKKTSMIAQKDAIYHLNVITIWICIVTLGEWFSYSNCWVFPLSLIPLHTQYFITC